MVVPTKFLIMVSRVGPWWCPGWDRVVVLVRGVLLYVVIMSRKPTDNPAPSPVNGVREENRVSLLPLVRSLFLSVHCNNYNLCSQPQPAQVLHALVKWG